MITTTTTAKMMMMTTMTTGADDNNVYLVRVDGHAGGEAHHGDAVEAGGVGHGRGRQVVVGLGRVAHQDGIDLESHVLFISKITQNT